MSLSVQSVVERNYRYPRAIMGISFFTPWLSRSDSFLSVERFLTEEIMYNMAELCQLKKSKRNSHFHFSVKIPELAKNCQFVIMWYRSDMQILFQDKVEKAPVSCLSCRNLGLIGFPIFILTVSLTLHYSSACRKNLLWVLYLLECVHKHSGCIFRSK